MADNDAVHVLTEQDLNRLQLTTLQYYLHEANPENGLIRDKTEKGAPASIAAVGLALASLPILVERGVVSREFAPAIALRRLRFFRDSPHGPEPDATGYKGFHYHFLDMKTGRRVWRCELSTIDSAFLSHRASPRTSTWLQFRAHGEDTVALKHVFQLTFDEAVVLVQRQYYVSTGTNAEQAIVVFLSVQGRTLVIHTNHTSTDQLTGVGGGAKRTIGRSLMARQLKDVFETTRAGLGQ